MARVLIGTSGWYYDSWRGRFYPAGLPTKAQLQYYASQFQTAELNGVFYRTPSPGEPEFVRPGDVIDVYRTLCLMEAMKTGEIHPAVTHYAAMCSG